VVARLDHHPTRTAVTAERALLERLEGGCQVPIAAHAAIMNGSMTLSALIAGVDGRRLVRDSLEGPMHDAHRLGVRLANGSRARGDEILKEIYGRADEDRQNLPGGRRTGGPKLLTFAGRNA